jgi:hypothetical protein
MKKQRERKILFHIDSVIAAEVYIYIYIHLISVIIEEVIVISKSMSINY